MREEKQVKIKGEVSESFLIEKGGELLGKTLQQDTYFLLGGKTLRVREEGESLFLTEKGEDSGKDFIRERDVVEKNITKSEFQKMKKEIKKQILIYKTRSIFVLEGVHIAIDDVEHLGNFLEIRGNSSEAILGTIEALGLDNFTLIKEDYLNLMLKEELSPLMVHILRFHEKVGELSFGITSGILTTLGLIIGVNAATTSMLAVIASIVTISVADSCSDSFGMYMSKVSERGSSKGDAIRYASGTLLGKFFFPLTFIIPILILGLNIGIILDVLWGIFVLAILSTEQAIVEQESVIKRVFQNTILAVAIILLSFIAGSIVSGLV